MIDSRGGRGGHHADLALDQAERAVVVGQVPHQVVIRAVVGWRAAGTAGAAPRGRDVGGVGDRLPAGPDPGMVSHETPVEADPDPFQVGGDVDQPADRGRVDGVVDCVDADVVVPAQPDPFPPAHRRWHRRQRQHRGPIGVDQVDRSGLDGAHHPAVRRLSHSPNWALKSAGEAKSGRA